MTLTRDLAGHAVIRHAASFDAAIAGATLLAAHSRTFSSHSRATRQLSGYPPACFWQCAFVTIGGTRSDRPRQEGSGNPMSVRIEELPGSADQVTPAQPEQGAAGMADPRAGGGMPWSRGARGSDLCAVLRRHPCRGAGGWHHAAARQGLSAASGRHARDRARGGPGVARRRPAQQGARVADAAGRAGRRRGRRRTARRGPDPPAPASLDHRRRAAVGAGVHRIRAAAHHAQVRQAAASGQRARQRGAARSGQSSLAAASGRTQSCSSPEISRGTDRRPTTRTCRCSIGCGARRRRPRPSRSR